jgi:type IV pilus assembly protein PilX
MTRGMQGSPSFGNRHQQGIALVVVLVLLIAVSLLGVAVMRSANMQERMSANLRDRSLAFEAAESTLEFVRTTMETTAGNNWHQGPPSDADCTSRSICPLTAAARWISAPNTAYDATRLPAAPEYWVQYIGPGVSIPDPDNTCGAAADGPRRVDCESHVYRVIVRSRAAGRADVVIQGNLAGNPPRP